VELVLLSPHNFMSVTFFPADHSILKGMILVSLPMAWSSCHELLVIQVIQKLKVGERSANTGVHIYVHMSPPPPHTHTHTNMRVHTCGHSDKVIPQTCFLFTKYGGFLKVISLHFSVNLRFFYHTIMQQSSTLFLWHPFYSQINFTHTKGSTSNHVPSMVFILTMLECETSGQSCSFKACHLMMLSIAMSI
jgi:hypothetical protein